MDSIAFLLTVKHTGKFAVDNMMVKKAVFLIFLLLNGAFAFAQNEDSVIKGPAKAKIVNGISMSQARSVLDNISMVPDFSTLVNAIKTVEVTDKFNGTVTVTLFAPNNKAFEKLPPGVLDTLLLPAHKADLANLILYHAVAGKITSKDINRQIKAGNGQATFTTLAGGILTARINENRNIVLTDESGGQSVISRFDIEQNNGILHIITAVLTPRAK